MTKSTDGLTSKVLLSRLRELWSTSTSESAPAPHIAEPPARQPVDYFRSDHYDRHNRRRQEHLATLGLPLAGKTVLEVGAGIGDHTGFFLDRGCRVTCAEGRPELLDTLKARYPGLPCVQWDVETSPPAGLAPHDIVYAYGLLYHTRNPGLVLKTLSEFSAEMLLLETCVSCGEDAEINLVPEAIDDLTQALHGTGCRPTRRWIFETLGELYPHRYVTRTQPWQEEFPIDWTIDHSRQGQKLVRSVFVAATHPLDERLLSPVLINAQSRC